MTGEAEAGLATAAAALLRSLPEEHRVALLRGMIASHRSDLARLRPDLLPAELERRTAAYRAAVEAALAAGD